MSVKLKVSYTEDGELTVILSKLSPLVKECKPKPPQGKYKRAYIRLKDSALYYDLVNKKG